MMTVATMAPDAQENRHSIAREFRRDFAFADDYVCPDCRTALIADFCARCGRLYGTTAGFPDYRLSSDRYLGLEQERGRAEELARLELITDLLDLASAYYEITGDPRRERFLDHIAHAEARSEPLADHLARSVGRNARILDVGCGTGGLVAEATRRGLSIVGVDIASRWLVAARRRLKDRGLSAPLIAADATRLPWADHSFDAVVADSLLEHLDDPKEAMREWHRVLKPNGRLLLWSPNRRSLMPDPHVGLWGLGWLPKSWTQRRIKRELGEVWLPKTLTSGQAKRLADESGFVQIRTAAPEVSETWARTRSNRMIRGIAAYQQARRIPFVKAGVRALGPLWELRATASKPLSSPGLDIDDPAYFERLAQAEHLHWWPSAMQMLADHWLDQALRGRSDLDVLDAGCGSGTILHRLAQRKEVRQATGLDLRREALAWTRKLGDFRLAQGSVSNAPFGDHQFDLIVCNDVLQHMPDQTERLALDEFHRLLRPGGWLLLRTNADGWLKRSRRPDAPEPMRMDRLKRLVREAGFSVKRATHANALPSLAAELRGLTKREPSHPAGGGLRLQAPPPWINRALAGVGRCEAWLAGRCGIPLPRGHSLLILARRDAESLS